MNRECIARKFQPSLPRRGLLGFMHTHRLPQENPPGSSVLRSVHALLFAAMLGCAVPVHAASCTVILPEYAGTRSGECSIDDATQTVVIYDADYWGKRGRKLLVPQAASGRELGSFIAIAPTDVGSNEVAHAMSYRITVRTSKGIYRFDGTTKTHTYRAHTPPEQWAKQRPNGAMDFTNKLTTAELLAELQAIKPMGPALSLDAIEKVITQNQDLADRLPTLAGLSQAGGPLPSTAARQVAGTSGSNSTPPDSGGSSRKAASPAASTGTGLRPIWPSDMEPGNIYFVVEIDKEDYPPIMVSALSGQEAVARVQAARAKDRLLRPTTFKLLAGRECIGPAWGAVVTLGWKPWGAACANTPAAAIEGAFTGCRQHDPKGRGCEPEPSIVLALSGSTSWSSDTSAEGLHGRFGSYNAQTWMEQYTKSPINSMQQALSGFDKACSDGRPCYKTSSNTGCIHENTHSEILQKCMDRKLTPGGLSGSIRSRLR